MFTITPSVNGHSALDTAIRAAQKAGNLIRKHIADIKNISRKGRGNLVSDLDIDSESIIVKTLNQAYPDFSIISEEKYSHNSASGFTWIIDPLDGTTNSVFGIPFISVNISLTYDDTILLGLTYDPIREEIFTSEKGKGSYLNQKSVRASNISIIEDAVICADLGYDTSRGAETLQILHKLWGRALCLRILGSAALGLAYVACGRINLYFHRSIYPWDIASGILLVRESGGEIFDWDKRKAGYKSKEIIAANKSLLNQFTQFVNI